MAKGYKGMGNVIEEYSRHVKNVIEGLDKMVFQKRPHNKHAKKNEQRRGYLEMDGTESLN